MTLCGFVANHFSTGVDTEVMAQKQLIFRLFLLYSRPFASIRGSNLFSIIDSKVINVPISDPSPTGKRC